MHPQEGGSLARLSSNDVSGWSGSVSPAEERDSSVSRTIVEEDDVLQARVEGWKRVHGRTRRGTAAGRIEERRPHDKKAGRARCATEAREELPDPVAASMLVLGGGRWLFVRS